jgi:hypothetical protein
MAKKLRPAGTFSPRQQKVVDALTRERPSADAGRRGWLTAESLRSTNKEHKHGKSLTS